MSLEYGEMQAMCTATFERVSSFHFQSTQNNDAFQSILKYLQFRGVWGQLTYME